MPVIRIQQQPRTVIEWREVTAIYRYPAGNLEALDGWQYGTLVIHPALPADLAKGLPPVVVAHRPTMLVILRLDSPNDAITAVEYLWNTCGAAFARPAEEVDKSKIPPNVVQWIKSCNQRRKFLPPLPS